MDVSRSLRRHLRHRLTSGAPELSFVVPDGLYASPGDEQAALELLCGALDLLLPVETTPERVFLAARPAPAMTEGHTSFVLERQGGCPQVRGERVASLHDMARRIGAHVIVDQPSAGVISVTVTIASAERR